MSDAKSTQVQIRWLIRRDMPEVLQIERRSFEYYWTEQDFLACLRERNCIGMVAETGDKIVGFMIYELLKSQLHVLNFATCPQHRHQGVGRAMVDKLKHKLSQQRRAEIRLEVRDSNIAAQLFFKACGFTATDVHRGYYEDSAEDAYAMRFVLGAKPRPDKWSNRVAKYFCD